MKMSTFLLLALCLICTASEGSAFQCNVCHSKNPAMVSMHKATQAKGIGCFDCHRVGEKLMGNARPKDRNSLLSRRVTESPCIECHGNEAKK